jgi:dihydroorotate dehydrogenase (NAD+) catalytic subunit
MNVYKEKLMPIDLRTKLGNWVLDNPVIAASGTFGFGYEAADWYDVNILGSIVLKSVTRSERFGNQAPRITECRYGVGILNSIGLQNPGVEFVVKHEIPKLKKVFHKKIIASIAGFSVDEYVYVAQAFDLLEDVAILEINLSCPNVGEKGELFASSIDRVYETCCQIKKSVKKDVYAKLSVNDCNIVELAKAAESAGVDGLVLINTLLGIAIDPVTGKSIIPKGPAGFSGPAIKPIALCAVYKVYSCIKIPIIGVGGISCADDVIEFISAGASAVEIGTQNLVDPFACKSIITELKDKLVEYNLTSISKMIGRTHLYK